MKIEWEEKYSVGNKEIDNQHKKLFNLANTIELAKKSHVTKIIMGLYKYTRRHFTAEEKMMEESGYPYLLEHKELHDDLITKLNKISETAEMGQDIDMEKLRVFVFEWLTDHILKQDKDYMGYLRD